MKTYTKDELKGILEEHVKWLFGNGGQRADLRSADLRSADLRYAILRYANLRSANLRSADLRYANLSSANLRYANLGSADLSYTILSSADLSKKYLQISCIGSRKGITTFCVEDDLIWCGCWKGKFNEFMKRVKKTYPDKKNRYRIEYDRAIVFFKAFRKSNIRKGGRDEQGNIK